MVCGPQRSCVYYIKVRFHRATTTEAAVTTFPTNHGKVFKVPVVPPEALVLFFIEKKKGLQKFLCREDRMIN